MKSNIFRVKEFFNFDVSSSDVVCSWKGEGETIVDEGNYANLLSANETLFDKKEAVSYDNFKNKSLINFFRPPVGIIDGNFISYNDYENYFYI